MMNFRFDEEEEDSDLPMCGDMQAWSDSLQNVCELLGDVYADADLLQGHYMRPLAEEEPAAPVESFDPYDCTVLNKPMNVRRARITMKIR